MNSEADLRDSFLFQIRGAGFIMNLKLLLCACVCWCGMAFAILCPLFSIGTIWWWLKTGTWLPFDNAAFLWVFDDFREWLHHPDSWYGWHQILDWLFRWFPIGLLGFPVGVAVGIGGSVMRCAIEEKHRQANQPPLPTPVECPPSNHGQVPGAADL